MTHAGHQSTPPSPFVVFSLIAIASSFAHFFVIIEYELYHILKCHTESDDL